MILCIACALCKVWYRNGQTAQRIFTMSVAALNAEPHYMRNRPCFPAKNQKRSKVNEISFSKRIKIVFYTVAHSVPFRAGKLNDGLCADNRPVQKQRLGAYYGAALGMLLCAIRTYEHFRGSLKRQVGQKSNYACVRQLCRSLHHCYVGTA